MPSSSNSLSSQEKVIQHASDPSYQNSSLNTWNLTTDDGDVHQLNLDDDLSQGFRAPYTLTNENPIPDSRDPPIINHCFDDTQLIDPINDDELTLVLPPRQAPREPLNLSQSNFRSATYSFVHENNSLQVADTLAINSLDPTPNRFDDLEDFSQHSFDNDPPKQNHTLFTDSTMNLIKDTNDTSPEAATLSSPDKTSADTGNQNIDDSRGQQNPREAKRQAASPNNSTQSSQLPVLVFDGSPMLSFPGSQSLDQNAQGSLSVVSSMEATNEHISFSPTSSVADINGITRKIKPLSTAGSILLTSSDYPTSSSGSGLKATLPIVSSAVSQPTSPSSRSGLEGSKFGGFGTQSTKSPARTQVPNLSMSGGFAIPKANVRPKSEKDSRKTPPLSGDPMGNDSNPYSPSRVHNLNQFKTLSSNQTPSRSKNKDVISPVIGIPKPQKFSSIQMASSTPGAAATLPTAALLNSQPSSLTTYSSFSNGNISIQSNLSSFPSTANHSILSTFSSNSLLNPIKTTSQHFCLPNSSQNSHPLGSGESFEFPFTPNIPNTGTSIFPMNNIISTGSFSSTFGLSKRPSISSSLLDSQPSMNLNTSLNSTLNSSLLGPNSQMTSNRFQHFPFSQVHQTLSALASQNPPTLSSPNFNQSLAELTDDGAMKKEESTQGLITRENSLALATGFPSLFTLGGYQHSRKGLPIKSTAKSSTPRILSSLCVDGSLNHQEDDIVSVPIAIPNTRSNGSASSLLPDSRTSSMIVTPGLHTNLIGMKPSGDDSPVVASLMSTPSTLSPPSHTHTPASSVHSPAEGTFSKADPASSVSTLEHLRTTENDDVADENGNGNSTSKTNEQNTSEPKQSHPDSSLKSPQANPINFLEVFGRYQGSNSLSLLSKSSFTQRQLDTIAPSALILGATLDDIPMPENSSSSASHQTATMSDPNDLTRYFSQTSKYLDTPGNVFPFSQSMSSQPLSQSLASESTLENSFVDSANASQTGSKSLSAFSQIMAMYGGSTLLSPTELSAPGTNLLGILPGQNQMLSRHSSTVNPKHSALGLSSGPSSFAMGSLSQQFRNYSLGLHSNNAGTKTNANTSTNTNTNSNTNTNTNANGNTSTGSMSQTFGTLQSDLNSLFPFNFMGSSSLMRPAMSQTSGNSQNSQNLLSPTGGYMGHQENDMIQKFEQEGGQPAKRYKTEDTRILKPSYQTDQDYYSNSNSQNLATDSGRASPSVFQEAEPRDKRTRTAPATTAAPSYSRPATSKSRVIPSKKKDTKKSKEAAKPQSSEDTKSSRSKPACPVCQKIFRDRYYLDRHMVTHTGVKAFKCAICMMGFTQEGHLSRHIRTLHVKEITNVTPMNCTTTFGCSGKFILSVENLSSKSYKCPECAMSCLIHSLLLDYNSRQTTQTDSTPPSVTSSQSSTAKTSRKKQ